MIGSLFLLNYAICYILAMTS